MSDLTDTTALVTGASRGIGAATARALARDGARVLLAGRNERALQAVADDLPGAEIHVCDLSDPVGIEALADAARHVDVLVNNAGVSILAAAGAITGLQFKELYTVNVMAPLLLGGRIGAQMADRGHGAIVNVSSGLTQEGTPMFAAYGGTKGAVEAITRSLAAELGPGGVRVNAVAPGPVLTDMTAALTQIPGAVDRLAAQSPLGRLSEPEDVADAIAFLASPAARFVSGHVLAVDGALSSTVEMIDPAVLAGTAA